MGDVVSRLMRGRTRVTISVVGVIHLVTESLKPSPQVYCFEGGVHAEASEPCQQYSRQEDQTKLSLVRERKNIYTSSNIHLSLALPQTPQKFCAFLMRTQ